MTHEDNEERNFSSQRRASTLSFDTLFGEALSFSLSLRSDTFLSMVNPLLSRRCRPRSRSDCRVVCRAGGYEKYCSSTSCRVSEFCTSNGANSYSVPLPATSEKYELLRDLRQSFILSEMPLLTVREWPSIERVTSTDSAFTSSSSFTSSICSDSSKVSPP